MYMRATADRPHLPHPPPKVMSNSQVLFVCLAYDAVYVTKIELDMTKLRLAWFAAPFLLGALVSELFLFGVWPPHGQKLMSGSPWGPLGDLRHANWSVTCISAAMDPPPVR